MKILCNFARVILNNVTFKTVNADLTALPKHNKLIIKTINFLFTFNNYFIMKYFKLKFLLLFAALAVALPPAWAASVTDVITAADLAATSTSYTDFSGVTKPSGAVYAGRTALNGTAIQINSNEPIGIVSSSSGGTVKSITLYFSTLQTSTKTINVYGKHSAYSTAKDLYDKSTRGTLIQGLSSYNYNGNKYTITDDYEYIGISSNSGAAYIDKIEIEWSTPEDYEAQLVSNGSINFGKTAPNTPITKDVTVKNTGLQPITPVVSVSGVEFSTTYTPTTIAKGETATIPLVFTPTTTGTFEGTLHIGAQESENISLDASLSGISAYELTVCNNNETSGYLPVYGYNHDSYNQINQMVYPSTMLQSLNGKKITTMTFHLSDGLKFYNGDVTFSLANLSANTPPYESSPTRIEGFTKVHTEVMPGSSQPSLTEWTILFDEPFTYTGGDLLIDVATTKGDWGTTYFYGATQGSNQSYYTSANNTYTPVKFLPKITFGYEDGGAVVEPTPELVVDPDELDLDEATTFTVMGSDLKGDVTITVDNANFTVTPATIIKADAEEGATVTVAYTGTNTDGEIATITVASQGAESATVTVMGAAPKPVTVEKPVFDPEDGTTFEKNLTVTLTCETTGATIQYSYNNEYFTNYAEPIVIDETTTIYAKAVLGEVESEVVSATYTKEAAPGIITDFKETFTDCDGTGGNDGSWSGNIASSAFSDSKADNAGWALVSGNAANECIKIGTGSKQGSATTPNIAVTPGITYTLTFNAGAWEGDQTTLNISATGGNLSQSTVTLNSGSWNNYTLTFTATDEIATITFSGFQASKARFFLDEIVLSHEASAQPTQVVATPTFNPAQGEYTEAQNVTITCATEDAVIHYTVDGTDPTAESPVYDEAIAVGETMTIKAIAMKEGMTNSEIATATYTINIPSGDGKIYVKLTTDALTPGKKYIFVYEGEQAKAMGAFNSSSTKCNPVDVTINNNEVNIAGKDDIIEFTAGEGPAVFGSDIKQYTLALPNDQYLAYKSGTDFKLMTSTDTEAYWRIKAHASGYTVYNASASGRSIQKNTSTNMFGPYADGQDLVAIYVEKSDEPVVEELTVALDPAEKTYTVGEVAKIMVNVENGNEDTMVSYKINDGEDQDYNAETGIVLPNDKAKEYTVTVYATDGDREATATGTYSFTAAPAFEITLTPNKEGNYTVGDNAVVTVAVDKYIGEDYLVTYTIGDSEEQIEYNAETGIVLPNDKAGDVTVKVYVTDGYEHAGDEFVSATYHFDAAPDIVVTLDPASGNYYLGEQVKVTVTTQNTIGDYEVTYKIGDGEELEYEDGITITSDQEGTVNLTVTVVDGYHDGAATATGAYTFAPRPVVAMPTLSLVGGTYGEAQQLTITAEDGATILYSTDGSEPTTEYTSAIDLGEGTTTVKAIAMKDGYTMSPEVSATYIIEIPEELPTITAFDGYYQVKNNGNDQYANIAGRKTLNFTNDIDKAAGTVIRLKTNDKGQVQVLRSQAADLQRYADRAVEYYVPKAVELIAQKLQADGAGNILGENGLDAIMDKFNSSFDHHLYVEQAGEGWRIYGKTPSMQPVVDFYRENTSKVEQKLPMLESFINSALDKLKEKIGGSSVFQPFSLLNIWERMGGTLTKPEDDASIMAFYREVLNNKYYVWDFAYQTATFYIENLKNHPRWPEVQEQLGELAQYIDKIENVRPEFKYYIVQKDGKPDYISEGNADIRNNEPRTIWTVEPRTTFTVNFPEENISNKMYVTTLYTDFAYDLPEGVTAYKVTEISESSVAKQEAITGTVPAQTPVILMSTTAGDQVLTLNLNDGTRPADNLLQGPDYLVNYYDFKTPQLVNLFAQLKNKLGEDFYNNYVKDYEYLMDLNSGTVNNKYFWNVNADLDKLTDEPIVRDLAVDDMGKLAFSDHWTTENNKAFLVDLQGEHNVIFLSMRGDVNKDGYIKITDVTAWIDLKLETTPYQYLEPTAEYPNGLDYEAADYNENGELKVDDLADLIQFILMRDLPEGDNPEEPVEP
jgi:hypothetical protein